MAFWLCKQEPGCYSFQDLVADNGTSWDGVANALARKHLRSMCPGDQVFYYHTGKEKAVVGIMEVVSEPQNDPKGDDKGAVAVQMKPVRALTSAVTLAQIKAEKALLDWDLVRISRLSVVPVSKSQWERVLKLAKAGERGQI